MDLIKETEVLVYLKKAESSFSAGNYKTALEDYLKVAELSLALQRDEDVGAAYRRIAECYHNMKVPLKEEQRKNFREAVGYYSKAAERHVVVEKYLQAGDCYENASKLSEELGEVDKAIEYGTKSISVYVKSGDLLSTSHAYLYTARYYEKLGQLDSAAENYEKAGELNMQISDDRRAASNYTSAAECYKKMGKFDKAINALANSTSANLKLREYSKIADTYEEIAESYMKINDFKNSLYYYKKSAELRFDNKNYAGTGLTYFKMGVLYESRKEYDTALKHYLQSAEVSLSAKSFEQAASSYEKVGECYEKLGDPLKASEYYVYSAKTSVSAGKTEEAFKTYEMAGKNFVEQAESKLIEKDYENAALYYSKALECYTGLENYSKVGDVYVKKAQTHLKAGEKQKTIESYLSAAGSYKKAGDEKNAGYNYKMAGDYENSALSYIRYAEKKGGESNDFQAGEGYKFAGRAYSKFGADSERRDSYNKAVWHYGKILKRKSSGAKEEIRLTADASENIGECYVDISDFHNAERYFQQAVDLYTSIDYPLGVNLSSAFLNRVKGEIALELGRHTQASEMFKTSLGLFDSLVNTGRFDADFTNYLKEQKDTVGNLIQKIELKPEIELIVDKQVYAFTDTILIMNGVLSNNGQYTINIISFLSHLPEEFELVKLPPNIKELKPKESVRVSADITVKKPGEYVVRPFEIFYKDDKGNKYVKASNETMVYIDERPPEDFKNFRLAVEVYSRYGRVQLSNKNYFYAGDGFKRAAEVYGKFNADEKLKEYYGSAIDAYSEYTKTQPKDVNDLVAMERMGDAFWNIAESYDAIGDFDTALKNYRESLGYYEKSNTKDKLSIGNAFISEIEAKKSIEHGEYSNASEMLSRAIEFFNEALRKGGLSATQLKLIDKHNSEARMLIDKIKGTPVVLLTVEAPQKVYMGKKFTLKASLMNPGEIALKKIRFMIKVPESFIVEKAPTELLEATPKSSQNILIDIIAKKAGEYKFKPLDMFYTDDKNNSYMHGSNQIMIDVVEKELKHDEMAKISQEEAAEKPELDVILEQPSPAAKDIKMILRGVIENNSPVAVSGIRFLVNAPQDFEVVETPEVLKELNEKSKEKISIELTPHKEGEYTFKPIEIFYRDAHGNRFFKSSNELTIKVVAAIRIKEARAATVLETGLTYLVEDEDRAPAVKILGDHMGEGYAGLYITRVNPEQINKTYNLAGAKFIWLTDVKDAKYTTKSSPSDISIIISEFISSNEKSFILMEGVEYLMDISGFTDIVEFIKFQRDKISSKDSKLVILVNPNVLDQKQLQRLEHECILYKK